MSECKSGPAYTDFPQGRWKRDCRDWTVNSGTEHPGYRAVQEEQIHAAKQRFAKLRGYKSQQKGQKSLGDCWGLMFGGSSWAPLIFVCKTVKGPSSHPKWMVNAPVDVVWVCFWGKKCFQLRKPYSLSLNMCLSFQGSNPSSITDCLLFLNMCTGPALNQE